MKMDDSMIKHIIFIIFMIFNGIFGLSGLAVIGGGIYLIVKIEFNQYIVIIIGLGIIIAAIFALGLFTWKKTKPLFIYMITIIIVFVLEVALVLVIKFHEDTKNFIRKSIKDLTEEKKDEIINVSVIIISIAAGCSFLSFILSLLYYRKLKDKTSKLIEDKKGDEYMKGLDYTNLNPDISAI